MRGANIDLGKLMSKQERNISVGNTKSNARGDHLGRAGRVVKSADEIARDHYNRNNPNAVARASIKLDDGPKDKKPMTDDWEEPVNEKNEQRETSDKDEKTTQESNTSVDEEKIVEEQSVEEEEWVEDENGNFVRKSELNEPVSKSKKSSNK